MQRVLVKGDLNSAAAGLREKYSSLGALSLVENPSFTSAKRRRKKFNNRQKIVGLVGSEG